tara:strand:- start:3572 stop:3733 length:162 start_codon:yes stop_codon:yes gene_type:complete
MKGKKGGGAKKYGRNVVKCSRYRAENRRERNKARRARRIAKGFRKNARIRKAA